MKTLLIEHETDTAHRLSTHKGKCKNIHGHRYRFIIEVDVQGTIEDGPLKFLDFYDFKKTVRAVLDYSFDHKIILADCSNNKDIIKMLKENNLEFVLFAKEPTVEYMIEYTKILFKLEVSHLPLRSITIYETPTNYCKWTKEGA